MASICRCTDESQVAVSANQNKMNAGQEVRGDAPHAATASPAYDIVFIGAGVSTSYTCSTCLPSSSACPARAFSGSASSSGLLTPSAEFHMANVRATRRS